MFLGFPSIKAMKKQGLYLLDYYLVKAGVKKASDLSSIGGKQISSSKSIASDSDSLPEVSSSLKAKEVKLTKVPGEGLVKKKMSLKSYDDSKDNSAKTNPVKIEKESLESELSSMYSLEDEELTAALESINKRAEQLIESFESKEDKAILQERIAGESIPNLIKKYGRSRRAMTSFLEEASYLFYEKVYAYEDIKGMRSVEIAKAMGIKQQSVSSVINIRKKDVKKAS